MAALTGYGGRRIAGIELGGTKTIIVLGVVQADGCRIVDRHAIPTTTPDRTLSGVLARLHGWEREAPLEAIGVASFGPVRVAPAAADYGTILATPKPGWSGTPVLETLRAHFACPIGLDTDVNSAALAEHAFGAARGCGTMVYITIGTGIGAGVLVEGVPVHGLLHPEIGHIRIRRAAGDGFAGTCPFHGDCAEGLISGPALDARLPAPPASLPPDHPAWDAVGADLAELVALLMIGLSPERIVIGGGVANGQPHLLQRARSRIPALLNGYLPGTGPDQLAAMIRPPELGDDAGPTGALVLAARAIVAQPETAPVSD